MKWAHVLRKNAENFLPTNHIFVDTETYPTEGNGEQLHTLRFGHAIRTKWKPRDDEEFSNAIDFTKVEDFWDWAELQMHEKEKWCMWAHNTHFDFSVLQGMQELTRRGWKMKSWFVNSNVFVMKWRKDTRSLSILDSGNILKAPLALIAKNVGMEKMDVDVFTKDDALLARYCRNDTMILKKWIMSYLRFLRLEDLGNFRPTLAGQSFQAFKHRFMTQDIFIHDNMKAYALERLAYHGGRTECWQLGELPEANYFLLDVNSMYPFVMDAFEYPVKLVGTFPDSSPKYLESLLGHYCVIADCLIETSEPVTPVHREKTIFPVGRFWTTLSTPEIAYLSAKGAILKVGKTAIYEKNRVFRPYIRHFFAMKRKHKQKKDVLHYQISKLFLNSLYGKFGQLSQAMNVIGTCDPNLSFMETVRDMETKTSKTIAYLNGKVWEVQRENESFDSFPAIAAHVTAYARMHLWKFIQEAGKENVFYMDTDSLLVNDDGYNRLKPHMDEEELGKLDLERVVTHVVLHGAKDYVMDDKVKIKGIKSNAKSLGDNRFEQLQFLKFRGMLRQGLREGAIVRPVTKRLKRIYDKGRRTENNRVEPIQLFEETRSETVR